MYCADNITTDEGPDNWWIPVCGLSGGSSGGPWVQPMGTNGSGPLISVNSWGYTDGRSGMAGPLLSGNSAECLFGETMSIAFSSVSSKDGRQGVAVDYCN